MNLFLIIDYIVLFIVIYLLVMIGRWFVLPHLKVFPNIPPQWLWTSIVGVIMYAFNAIFHYILMALLIIYIIWMIIKLFVPNFPIPIKRILLRMPPFYQLDKAGILPLIDRVRRLIFSTMTLSERVKGAGSAIGGFLASSTTYTLNKLGMDVPRIPYTGVPPPPQKQRKERKPSKKQILARKIAENESQQAYLQCIEESLIPITASMSDEEKKAASVRNQQNTALCKVDQIGTYSTIMVDAMERDLK